MRSACIDESRSKNDVCFILQNRYDQRGQIAMIMLAIGIKRYDHITGYLSGEVKTGL
jgi:hypothetical protein